MGFLKLLGIMKYFKVLNLLFVFCMFSSFTIKKFNYDHYIGQAAEVEVDLISQGVPSSFAYEYVVCNLNKYNRQNGLTIQMKN
uniref:hypothetical protein n=2 Tax=Gelidibacter sp. TaxID=2018083 RepID=UPI0040498A00